jgi:hypothetical protein
MATNLSGLTLAGSRVQLNALATVAASLSNPNDNLNIDEVLSAAFGATAGLVNQIHHGRYALTASGGGTPSVSLDLAALLNPLGLACNLATVKLVFIVNRSTAGTPASLRYGNGAATPFQGWLGAAANTEDIEAGGVLLRTALTAGWSTSGANILKVANLDAVDAATFDIVIVGVSA